MIIFFPLFFYLKIKVSWWDFHSIFEYFLIFLGTPQIFSSFHPAFTQRKTNKQYFLILYVSARINFDQTLTSKSVFSRTQRISKVNWPKGNIVIESGGNSQWEGQTSNITGLSDIGSVIILWHLYHNVTELRSMSEKIFFMIYDIECLRCYWKIIFR